MAMEIAAINSACACMRSLVVRDDICYVCLTEEKLMDLAREKKVVFALSEDVKVKLKEEGEKLGKIPTQQVKEWLEQGECTCNEAKDLENEYRGKWLVSGYCSINCCSRYNISRRADQISKRFKELKEERKKFEVLTMIPENIAMKIPVRPDLVEAITSPYVNQISNYLKDVAVNVIGICGMIGIGKTTLLRVIHNSLLDDGNHVIMIEDSHNLDLEKFRRRLLKEFEICEIILKETFAVICKDSAGIKDVANLRYLNISGLKGGEHYHMSWHNSRN
ncbi:putative disease resistance protein At4g10780 [Dioscorea cayenensis subsp. rotundata]|uniref:Disease resistance protein At4g10780 n=1 Tax=Dioscorea cayennensis subsp. rotundata TaxID=55577 RepID=A0AB40ANZ5_DIOCR|nr:putative disease resistance protein At4g10780 [Dioscorea cayenensis subsp. rotundata]